MPYDELVALKGKISAYSHDDDYRLLNIAIASVFHAVDVKEVSDEDRYVRIVAGNHVTFFEDCTADTVFEDEERIRVVHALIPDYFNSLNDAVAIVHANLGPSRFAWSVHEDPVGASAKVTWWPEGISGSRQIFSDSMQYTLPLSLIWCVIEVMLRENWFMKADGQVVKYQETWGMTSPGVPLCA